MPDKFFVEDKKQTQTREDLPGGVTKITIKTEPTGPDRFAAAFCTFFLSEFFVASETTTEYQYFYNGTFLGHSANQAAITANTAALNYCNQGKFDEAQNYFNVAYHTCTHGYRDEDEFKNSRDVMPTAIQAQRLLNAGRFSEAQNEFQKAYISCNVHEVSNILARHRDNAGTQANQAANAAYRTALEYCNQGKFDEAQNYFNVAYHTCTHAYPDKNKFKNSTDQMPIATQAQRLLDAGKFLEAYSKFQQAWNLCNVQDVSNILARYRDNAGTQANQAANAAYRTGLQLCDKGKFQDALNQFNTAHETCTNWYSQRTGFANSKDAMRIAIEAQNLFNAGEFLEAHNRFQRANTFSNVPEIAAILNRHGHHANVAYQNQTLNNMHRNAVQLCDQGKFQQALNQFHIASQACINWHHEKNGFTNSVHTIALAIEAQLLYNDGKFLEAQNKFKKAYDLCNVREISNILVRYRDNAGAQANQAANNAYQIGLNFCYQGNFEDALDQFNKAHETCTNSYSQRSGFANSRDAMRIAIEAQNLFDRGKFSEAHNKFQKAHGLRSAHEVRDILARYRDNAETAANQAANDSYRLGLNFCNRGNFVKAKTYFIDAYDKCTNGYRDKSKFKSSADAITAAIQAERSFSAGKFSEAHNKFQKAHGLCSRYEVSDILARYRDNAETQANQAANDAYRTGLDFCYERNFNEAKACFIKAYHTCTNDYRDKSKFKKSADAMTPAQQAEQLFNTGKYSEAHNKFQKAHGLCSRQEVSNILARYRDNAGTQANQAANDAYQTGLELCDKGKFQDALNQFNRAHDTCTNSYSHRSGFANSRDTMRIAVEAQNLFNTGKFLEAHNKFQKAQALCSLNRVSAMLASHGENARNFADKLEVGDKANRKALQFCMEGRFQEAQRYFSAAYHTCTNGSRDRENLHHCEQSMAMAIEAQQLLEDRKFEDAYVKFGEARALSNVKEVVNTLALYAESAKKCSNEMEAANAAHRTGLQLCNEGKFQDALNQFNLAHETCRNYYSGINEFSNIKKAMLIAMEAQNLLDSGKFAEAHTKFQDACDLSNVNEVFAILGGYRDRAKIAADKKEAADKMDERALQLCNEEKFAEAKTVFENAELDMTDLYREREKFVNSVHAMELAVEAQKLVNAGKAEEEAGNTESAIVNYQKAIQQFRKVAETRHLEVIFKFFIVLIDGFIRNGAYDEAKETIDYGKNVFPDKLSVFIEAEQLISDSNCSPACVNKYVKLVDQDLSKHNIMQNSDGC